MLMLTEVPFASAFLMQPALISRNSPATSARMMNFRVHPPASRWAMNIHTHGKDDDPRAGLISTDRPTSPIQPGMILIHN
jgi:hypothetical protein